MKRNERALRIARSLELLRRLNELRSWLGRVCVPANSNDAAVQRFQIEQATRRLADWDADCRARVDARQLSLFSLALLFCVGCSDGFTARFLGWETIDATTPSVDADMNDSRTTSPAPGTGGKPGRVFVPMEPDAGSQHDAGSFDAGVTTTVDVRITPPSTKDARTPDSSRPMPSGSVPVDAAPHSPSCTRFVGAVFVCSGATPVPYYPCPVRPPSCVQAGNTAVVCCPN
jgi:hypothetical protein